MTMMLGLCFFLALFVCGSSAAPTFTKQGQSGKLTFCPTGDCVDKAIGFQVDYIRELANGKKVSQHFKEQMASSTWSASSTSDVSLGSPNVTASKYSFNVAISVGSPQSAQTANLIVDTFYFTVPTTVMSGNTSITIPRDALKFDVTVSGWNFASPQNKLSVGILLTTAGASNPNAALANTTNGAAINYENFYFDTPNTAVYDGSDGPVTITSYASGSKGTGISFLFKSFTSQVIYDPVIGGSGTSGASHASFSALLFAALVLVCTGRNL
jgi:hypothetical protein